MTGESLLESETDALEQMFAAAAFIEVSTGESGLCRWVACGLQFVWGLQDVGLCGAGKQTI